MVVLWYGMVWYGRLVVRRLIQFFTLHRTIEGHEKNYCDFVKENVLGLAEPKKPQGSLLVVRFDDARRGDTLDRSFSMYYFLH